MVKIILALWIIGSSHHVIADSFQWELMQKSDQVREVIGEHKWKKIKKIADHIEIYRITELLNIDGIGSSTVFVLSEILGTRFFYSDKHICFREKIC